MDKLLIVKVDLYEKIKDFIMILYLVNGFHDKVPFVGVELQLNDNFIYARITRPKISKNYYTSTYLSWLSSKIS